MDHSNIIRTTILVLGIASGQAYSKVKPFEFFGDDNPLFHSKKCQPGDPICSDVTWDTSRKTPRFKRRRLKRRSKNAVGVIKSHRKETAQLPRLKPKKKRLPRKLPPGFRIRTDAMGNEIYEFNAPDPVHGQRYRSLDQIIVHRHRTPPPIECLKRWNDTVKDGATIASMQEDYRSALKCQNSCMTDRDLSFQVSCFDWKKYNAVLKGNISHKEYMKVITDEDPFQLCSKRDIRIAKAKNKIDDFWPDPKSGHCPQKTVFKPKLAIDVEQMTEQLANESSESLTCPENFENIEFLKKVQTVYDRSPHNVDVSELSIFPLYPDQDKFEGHLPMSCGYNTAHKRWFKQSIYCGPNKTCWVEYKRGKLRFSAVRGTKNLWKADVTATGKSYRYGGKHADMRIVPLGNSVHLLSYRARGKILSYDLIIVPKQKKFTERACRVERSLNRQRSQLAPNEVTGMVQKVAEILDRGRILEEVREITKMLEKKKRTLSKADVKRLRKKAKELLAILEDGKNSRPLALGQSACALLKAGTATKDKRATSALIADVAIREKSVNRAQ